QAEHIDSTLRYFFWKIRQSPVYDKINFIVTADHGMTELSNDRIANLYDVLDPQRVVRTVGGAPFGLEVEAGYEQEALRALRKVKGIRAFARKDVPAKYNFGKHPTRITNIVVMPDLGWTVEYRKPDVERRPIGRGAHGFDCFDRDMSMVFYGTGPAFRKGYEQRSFQDLNIYLILCHLLGIEPSENDGDWRAVRKMFVE
ncbi:MAG: alkaline phosphatase family protein, partial [Rikenellaceae bacterium]|nr:alkaline phosphatase family protein [Rikenellaceae bacterium]